MLRRIQPSFKLISSSSLSKKKYGGGNFTPNCTFFERLQGQNMSVGIGLVELMELFDALNYESFFENCILQTILHVFLFFIFVWNKILFKKLSCVLNLLGLVWGGIRCYNIKGSMFLLLFV